MKRARRITAVIVALIVLALAALRILDALFRETGSGFPTPLPAEVLPPAPTPSDGRRIAVLTLRVSSDPFGQVSAVETIRGEVETAFGPNVLNRPPPSARGGSPGRAA